MRAETEAWCPPLCPDAHQTITRVPAPTTKQPGRTIARATVTCPHGTWTAGDTGAVTLSLPEVRRIAHAAHQAAGATK